MMTKTTTKRGVEFEMRCKAFSANRVGTYRVQVGADDVVRVYDSVAGHYTRCHVLSAQSQRFARALARARADS